MWRIYCRVGVVETSLIYAEGFQPIQRRALDKRVAAIRRDVLKTVNIFWREN
ncbi:hypothetical protein KCP69_18280 [Salmonella enterica subsp. enterica]|nr:hypothetical protein KCP69_18280 [Salmonella enterica subsp. enterica]